MRSTRKPFFAFFLPVLLAVQGRAQTTLTGLNVIPNSAAYGSGPVALIGATLRSGAAGLVMANPFQLNGANTLDLAGNNTTYSGPLFGGGGLTFANTGGAAALVLSGNNYYSGGTAVNAGMTVGLAGINAFGSGAVALGGDTLQLQADGADLYNPITLTGANVVDASGHRATFYGALGGAGSLTLNDTGAGGLLNLKGSGSWAGPTVVNGGTLQLGAVNALPTTGVLTVGALGTFDMNGFNQTLLTATNNGALKTGAATLTVSGNYGGAGTLSVVPLPTAPSLSVTGVATLTGQTLNIAGRPATGSYTIVNAGTLAGTFAGIVLPSGYKDSFSYTGNDLFLSLFAPTFVQSGQTPNQSAIAAGLDQENASSSPDMNTVLVQLNNLTPAQLNAALDQISPVAYAAMSGVAFAGAGVQSAAVARRVAALQAGVSNPGGERVARYSVSRPSPFPGTLIADAGGVPAGVDAVKENPLDLPWGLFFSGLDTRGRLDDIGGGAGAQPGYTFATFGGTLGADYRFSDNFAAGLTAGYLTGGANLNDGAGHLSNSSFRVGYYATAWGEALRGDFYLGGAFDSFKMDRNVYVGSLARTATASPDGTEFNAAASGSYDLNAASFVLTPFLGLSYDRLMVGSFTEGGAGALDLKVGEQAADSLRSSLGAKLARKFQFDGFSLTPVVGLGWEHELVDQSRGIDAKFTAGAGGFTVKTADPSRDGLLLNAGLTWGIDQDVALRFDYSDDRRSNFDAYTYNGSLRVRF